MNPLRERAKEHFPTVLLTLLSIVQALALELLWSFLHENEFLFQSNRDAFLTWIQIAATFSGLMLVWVVYASNVMRFRWVPSMGDLIVPFLIGIFEFMLIDTLGPGKLGYWFMLMACVFGVMNWVSHATMRSARRDADNEEFFRNVEPAQLKDLIQPLSTVFSLLLVGVSLLAYPDNSIFAFVALLGINMLLIWQFYVGAQFWSNSLKE